MSNVTSVLSAVCGDCAQVIANGTDGWGLDADGRELGEVHAESMVDAGEVVLSGPCPEDYDEVCLQRHDRWDGCPLADHALSSARCHTCGTEDLGSRLAAVEFGPRGASVEGEHSGAADDDDTESRTVTVPRGTAHLSSADTYGMCADREGIREITDACAVTVASWCQVPRGPGEAFTRLVSHFPVTVAELHDAIAYERAQTVRMPEGDALALGMLATWALNRHQNDAA